MTLYKILEQLVNRYLSHTLPREIKVVPIPYRKTAYGDIEIELIENTASEYVFNLEIHESVQMLPIKIYAGYGEQTKTLFIGICQTDDRVPELTQ